MQALSERLGGRGRGRGGRVGGAVGLRRAEDRHPRTGLDGGASDRDHRAPGEVPDLRAGRRQPAPAAPLPGRAARHRGAAEEDAPQGRRGADPVRQRPRAPAARARHRTQGRVVGARPGRRRTAGPPRTGARVGRVRRADPPREGQAPHPHDPARPAHRRGDRARLRRRRAAPRPRVSRTRRSDRCPTSSAPSCSTRFAPRSPTRSRGSGNGPVGCPSRASASGSGCTTVPGRRARNVATGCAGCRTSPTRSRTARSARPAARCSPTAASPGS